MLRCVVNYVTMSRVTSLVFCQLSHNFTVTTTPGIDQTCHPFLDCRDHLQGKRVPVTDVGRDWLPDSRVEVCSGPA